MEDIKMKELLGLRREYNEQIKKYEKITALDDSITARVMLQRMQKRLKKVNEELMKMAM